MKLRKQLVGDTPYKFGRANKKTHITIHETGNPRAGATAAAHANLQSGGNHGAQAAWHYQVDDIEAVQSYTHDFQLWHAGDGYGNGNLHSIGIEVCVNSDGDFAKARENAAQLVKKIRADEKRTIPVVQHNHWSGKNCPQRMRADGGKLWSQFVNSLASSGSTNPTAPKLTVESTAREIVYGRGGGGNPWGNGSTRFDALRKAGLNADAVQRRVNELMQPKQASSKLTVEAAAREIVYGRDGRGNPWGNGQARFDALRRAGLNADAVQRRVNEILS